jgi:hypothetical protein
MRRDVRAIFVDGEQRAARGEAAAVGHGEVVEGDDRQDQRRGDGELAYAHSHGKMMFSAREGALYKCGPGLCPIRTNLQTGDL